MLPRYARSAIPRFLDSSVITLITNFITLLSKVTRCYHFVIKELSNVINMENPFVSARIPAALNEALEAQIQSTGKSRSKVLIEALEDYLGVDAEFSTTARIGKLEARVSVLEQILAKTSKINLEKLSTDNLESLSREELVEIAKDLGVYRYKLNRRGDLRETILQALKVETS